MEMGYQRMQIKLDYNMIAIKMYSSPGSNEGESVMSTQDKHNIEIKRKTDS